MLDQQKISKSSSFKGAVQLKIKDTLIAAMLHEAQTLSDVTRNIPDTAVMLVEKILTVQGKIIFSGVGKSGLVAQKLVATFSSLGFPSVFLHAGDALHGDLGVVQMHDIFIGLSKSATSRDLETIHSALSKNNIFNVLICCEQGPLSLSADLVVQLPFKAEACPLNLAPTSSSTAMLAFGDAVAIAASSLKNFNKNDFAKNHPDGALGRRLLLTVRNCMVSNKDLPLITRDSSFKDILYTVSSKKLGIAIVVGENNKLLGIITDGDLRRACDRFAAAVFDKNACDIMSINPKTISQEQLAIEAFDLMKSFNITSLVVVERGDAVIGVVHIHDLIKVGIKG